MAGAGRPYTPYDAAAEEGVDGGLFARHDDEGPCQGVKTYAAWYERRRSVRAARRVPDWEPQMHTDGGHANRRPSCLCTRAAGAKRQLRPSARSAQADSPAGTGYRTGCLVSGNAKQDTGPRQAE